MRHFDLSPLYRSTVGFDRLFSMLDQVAGGDAGATYPPYNIERTGEDAYRITVAVAGFSEAELSIEVKQGALAIRGSKEGRDDAGQRFLDRPADVHVMRDGSLLVSGEQMGAIYRITYRR